MTTSSSAPSGILGKITSAIGQVLGYVGLPWTQKFVSHILIVALSGAAVALLPLEISDQLNGLIVIVAGLIAHWVAPAETPSS